MNGVLVSIGTTHPWNIAGVGLDAHVAREYGIAHAMTIVAVSAQDATGLHALGPVGLEVVRAQLDAMPVPAAIRVGALVSSEAVRAVAEFVAGHVERVPVVVDPVLGASLGGDLAADGALEDTLMEALLTLPVIVTPNLIEAAELLERVAAPAEWYARAFVKHGARAALVKGGHAQGDDVTDVLADAGGVRELSARRLAGSMRGTGCTLAASLACELARGGSLDQAVDAARTYVREKIAAGVMRDGLQVAF